MFRSNVAKMEEVKVVAILQKSSPPPQIFKREINLQFVKQRQLGYLPKLSHSRTFCHRHAAYSLFHWLQRLRRESLEAHSAAAGSPVVTATDHVAEVGKPALSDRNLFCSSGRLCESYERRPHSSATLWREVAPAARSERCSLNTEAKCKRTVATLSRRQLSVVGLLNRCWVNV